MNTIEEFSKKMPKIELHAHLNGSLSEKTLKRLGCLDTNISHYQKLTKLLNTSDKTLNECFELFKVAQNATSNPKSVYFATKSVIEDFYEENVIYLEIRTTPRFEPDMTKTDYVEAVVKAIKDNPLEIVVKLLLSVDRGKDLDQETVDVILEMSRKYPEIIKGVDFSGNPHTGHFPVDSFQIFRRNGLKTTVHCAEIKNDEEVAKMLQFRPGRLGHATFLHPSYNGSCTNWDMYKELKIPLEICLTSNVVCGTSSTYKRHHLKEWIDNCLPFCLSTDDKGVFCTSLSKEFALAGQNFDLRKIELLNISYTSVDYSFASSEEKLSLKRRINEFCGKNRIY